MSAPSFLDGNGIRHRAKYADEFLRSVRSLRRRPPAVHITTAACGRVFAARIGSAENDEPADCMSCLVRSG